MSLISEKVFEEKYTARLLSRFILGTMVLCLASSLVLYFFLGREMKREELEKDINLARFIAFECSIIKEELAIKEKISGMLSPLMKLRGLQSLVFGSFSSEDSKWEIIDAMKWEKTKNSDGEAVFFNDNINPDPERLDRVFNGRPAFHVEMEDRVVVYSPVFHSGKSGRTIHIWGNFSQPSYKPDAFIVLSMGKAALNANLRLLLVKCLGVGVLFFIAFSLAIRFQSSGMLKSLGNFQSMDNVLVEGVVHNCKNVSNQAIGGLLLLREDLTKPGDLEIVDEVIKTIRQIPGPMNKLIGKDAIGTEIEIIDANKRISETVALARQGLARGVHIAVDLRNEHLPVVANFVELDHIILNLIVNARESMESGIITISAESRQLDQGFFKKRKIGEPGAYAVIKVSDKGKGIPAGDQKKIFDPSFSTKEGKRGVGLWTVKEALKKWNAFIEVKSKEGEGTEFTIFIPLSSEPAREEPRGTVTCGYFPASGRVRG